MALGRSPNHLIELSQNGRNFIYLISIVGQDSLCHLRQSFFALRLSPLPKREQRKKREEMYPSPPRGVGKAGGRSSIESCCTPQECRNQTFGPKGGW